MLEGMGMEPACGRALRAVVLRGQSSANLITSPRGEAAREAAPFFYPDPTLNFPQFSQFRNQPL
jgi:hypothetical protein